MELAIETYQRRVGVYKSSEKHGNFRIDVKDGWRKKMDGLKKLILNPEESPPAGH